MLPSFLSGEFLLHIPCLLCFSVGSFSYTSHDGFFFSVFFFFFFFLNLGSFSYRSRAGFVSMRGVSLTHPVLALFIFLSREFLLHIPCLLYFSVGSFSYTSHAVFIYKWGGVLLHIPYWLYFYLGCFSYTSHACFLWGEFLLHIPCWFLFFLSLMWGETQVYTSRAGFIFLWGVSLTHPMLISFFIAGSFSYTSRTDFVSIWGVSLTHPMFALVFCGEFLLHIQC